MRPSLIGSGVSTDQFLRPIRQQTLAAQAEQILGDRLRTGEFAPGDQLPTENELAKDFGVSRATIRTAISSLVRRGIIVQRHGVGNFAAAGATLANNLAEAVDFNVLIERGGSPADVVFDEVSVQRASAKVAGALGIGPEERVLRAAKRFLTNGTALIYVINSIPESTIGAGLAAQAVLAPDTTEPLFAFLEDEVGLTTSYQLAFIDAELGTAVGYPGVELGADVPLLRFDEIGYTAESVAIWHSTNWFPPSAMQFELIRHRNRATH